MNSLAENKSALSICGELVYKYRYLIAALVFVFCIIFEISGSSIGLWSNIVPGTEADTGVIFGDSRPVRSDEWAVHTPMIFSQQFDGFDYYSDVVRAQSTDVFINYGLPVLNPVTIFKPFQLGYLFLGASRGLSFFWCGRVIAMFMVCFELAMLLSNKKKAISLAAAAMITFSPMVQWWFEACGMAELFIFGSSAVVLLDLYTKSTVFWKRILMLGGMVVCAGGYALVMYPAWQVPMFFVYLALAVWIVIKNWKLCKLRYYDVISISVAGVIFAGSMAYVLVSSIDTISAIMGTVYPGSRMITGGGYKQVFTRYPIGLFLPFKDTNLSVNASEASTMFSLFPMGLILSVYALTKQKKKDLCLCLLLAVYAFFTLWCFVGFPEFLAKITLMYLSPETRTALAVGFVEILLIVRSLGVIENPFSRFAALATAVVCSFAVTCLCVKGDSTYFEGYKMLLISLAVLIILFYLVLRCGAKYVNSVFAVAMIVVMFFCGANVNPVRRGIDFLKENPLLQQIEEINTSDGGNWIVEGLEFPCINYPLMAGAPTINCTNTYPAMERWDEIDTQDIYEDIYNRYAHIKVHYDEEEVNEKFHLVQPDVFEVYLDEEDFETLDVKYVLTGNELPQEDFTLVYTYLQYKIYEMK